VNLKDKIILITGGTGSFGQAFVHYCLKTEAKEIRLFSRDENKQHELRKKIVDGRVKYFLGDVKDKESLFDAVRGANYIFHAAAYKHVTYMEDFPVEAVKTNILGTENVIQIATQLGVEKIVFLSTDKAVEPVNVMGMTKSLMEKVIRTKSQRANQPTLITVRYGNVMASRGSVIPLMVQTLNDNKTMMLRNPLSTRFMMTIDEAIVLVAVAFDQGQHGDIWIHPSHSIDLKTLYVTIAKIMNKLPSIKEEILNSGEKIHETLLTKEEAEIVIIKENYFVVPLSSTRKDGQAKAYISNEKQMTSQQLEILLKQDRLFQDLIR
jgi:UDP-glucose 4-epimerase